MNELLHIIAALLSLKSIPSYLGLRSLKKFRDNSLLFASEIHEKDISLLFTAVNDSVKVDFPINSNDEISGEVISLIGDPKNVLFALIMVC